MHTAFWRQEKGRPGPDNELKRRRMIRYIDFGITQEIREMIWSIAHVGNYCQRAWELSV